jgi:hypothetical protein
MIARTHYDFSRIDAIGLRIRSRCLALCRFRHDPIAAQAVLNQIRQLIDSIPMDSDEFTVAISRIDNAHRYLRSAETGAAQYEIRLLLGALNEVLERAGNEPHSIQPASTARNNRQSMQSEPRARC